MTLQLAGNTVEGSRARAVSRTLVTGRTRPAVVTPPNEHPRLTQPGVFVLDKHKRPLMPTSPRRAKQLLRSGRARVHRLTPFTIRLVDRLAAESTVEGVQLKIDPGSRATGMAVARTEADGTVHGLVAIEVQHRGALISRRLTARAGLRRARRARNLRYRSPRFDNRGRPQGWLAPSLRHRVETTETWVTRLSALAPVTSMSLELARFDLQKTTNPEISGTEYQQGTLAGFEAREYLLIKWRRRCAYCDAPGFGPAARRLNIDHIVPRAREGTDRISNLLLAAGLGKQPDQGLCGAACRNRTDDLLITSEMSKTSKKLHPNCFDYERPTYAINLPYGVARTPRRRTVRGGHRVARRTVPTGCRVVPGGSTKGWRASRRSPCPH